MKNILRKIYVKWLCLIGKAVDIHSKSKYPAGALSNFMPYTFIFRGMSFMSMESLLQGLKFEAVEEQNKVFLLVGVEAKRKGKGHDWHHNQHLWWQGKPMKRCSDEYRNFVEEAFKALSYNNDFQMALKATGNKRLYHTIGISDPTKTVLTEEEFCGILTRLRTKIFGSARESGVDKSFIDSFDWAADLNADHWSQIGRN